MLSEVRQKDKYHMISFICRILKNDANEIFLQNRLTDLENKFMMQESGGNVGRRDRLGVWD